MNASDSALKVDLWYRRILTTCYLFIPIYYIYQSVLYFTKAYIASSAYPLNIIVNNIIEREKLKNVQAKKHFLV